jgi:hypothetical protein
MCYANFIFAIIFGDDNIALIPNETIRRIRAIVPVPVSTQY